HARLVVAPGASGLGGSAVDVEEIVLVTGPADDRRSAALREEEPRHLARLVEVIGRAGRAGARAALRGVAIGGGGTADRALRLERIRRAVVADAVAAFRHVARSGGGTADVGALGIRGAVVVDAIAAFRDVA